MSSSSAPPPNKSETPTSHPAAASSLAPLLRHFVGIELIVETKNGRTFKGRLREADAFMNLVLSRTLGGSSGCSDAKATDASGVAAENFDWVHIRGSTIRYIVFGANIDLAAIIRAGRDRERAAGDKYKRGVRKAKN